MNEISLFSCRPEPLASYLKGLGVLRLIASQKDPGVVGWWQNDCLHLRTALDLNELLDFFINEYCPTPLVAPWNGGSGFYEGDTVSGRNAILESEHRRFAIYKQTIQCIMGWPEMPSTDVPIQVLINRLKKAADTAKGKKSKDFQSLINAFEEKLGAVGGDDEIRGLTVEQFKTRAKEYGLSKAVYGAAKKIRTAVNKLCRDADKESLIRACRTRLDDTAVDYLDTVILMTNDGPQFPSILAAGGIDGRLEFTNNQMLRLAELLLPEPNRLARGLLKGSILGEPAIGTGEHGIGQFDPGCAGGYNQGNKIESPSRVNAWDYILAMEGIPVWASSIVRRHETSSGGLLSSPFTVRPCSLGFGSAVQGEKSRPEIWAPLWSKPLGFAELTAFFGEGRAEVGRRRAINSIDFAQSVGSLGVDRGVTEFVRYSLLKRRGDSYIGLPTSRFRATERKEADFVRLLSSRMNSLNAWLRSTFKDNAPASLTAAIWAIEKAQFELLAHGGSYWNLELFSALGRLERLLGCLPPEKLPKSVPGGLPAEWLLCCDDNSLEVRLAGALASVRGNHKSGSLRCNWAPIDPGRSWKWYTNDSRRVRAWSGNSLESRLVCALKRRLLDFEEGGAHPLKAALSLHPEDIAGFIQGDVDDRKIETLMLGFSWLDWSEGNNEELSAHWKWPLLRGPLQRSWCLLKLLHWPGPLPIREAQVKIRTEPSIVSLLAGGREAEACDVGRRRLFASGLRPFKVHYPSSGHGSRIAASLIFSARSHRPLMERVLYPVHKEDNN
jgi:CRISPR-associated protein Csx17